MATEEDFDRKRPGHWSDVISQGRAQIRPRLFDSNVVEYLMAESPLLVAITGLPADLKRNGGAYGRYEQVTAACGMVAGANLLETTGVTQAAPIGAFMGVHGPRKQLCDILKEMVQKDPDKARLTAEERKELVLDALVEFDQVCAREIVDQHGILANAIMDGLRQLHKPSSTIDMATSPSR